MGTGKQEFQRDQTETDKRSNFGEFQWIVIEEETLSQLLESNFDLFWDLLGENMSDVYSLWESFSRKANNITLMKIIFNN